MSGLRDRLTRAPIAHEPARAEAALARAPEALASGVIGDLLRGATGSSPHLARLVRRHGDWLSDVLGDPPEVALDRILDEMGEARAAAAAREVSAALRLAKARAALLIALADLGGVWPLTDVTAALTRTADAAVATAASWLLRQEIAQGRLPGLAPEALEDGAGYVVLAMGKMGARELNYSSDIDLIALFDDRRFDGADVQDARPRYVHVTRRLVELLSENTAGGYVFRTDLRLRPTPSTTSVCMSMAAAEHYYETAGRTWERAAHIKARPLVDEAAGRAYLEALAPFVWRRHLDFAVIEDVHAMLRKIRAQRVRFTPEGLAGYDIKLGPGGIREIEFFAQTRQLVMGGRDPALRSPTTLGALDALAAAGRIDPKIRDGLTEDYIDLRTLEHRLQMIEDAQTQTVPKSPEARARVAALSGEPSLSAFEHRLADLLARVHARCEEFFDTRHAQPIGAAAHVTETRLAEVGFERPADAARIIDRWQRGEIAATRSRRAQILLTGLENRILEHLSGAADPDRSLAQFDRFLSGLPAGVQIFSLFAANQHLLDLIVEICSAAPGLAVHLAHHSQTFDALLDQDFWQPLPELPPLEADLRARLSPIRDYERALDETRRWVREHWFRVGVHVLRNLADPDEAGGGFSRIAETCIRRLLPRVIREFARRHGAPPGTGLAVLAMGKLGSNEMTAGSDLDLITIFDDAGVDASEGPKPLASGEYYRRLTRSLVLALTAPTAAGAAYEVDMRLRPSGRSGPVAVSLASFERYQNEEAWVWEHMALTRARTIAGPAALRRRVGDISARALAARDPETVLPEAREMRARLVRAHGAERGNPWAFKHAAGGLMEIEFLVQVGALLRALPGGAGVVASLEALRDDGWLGAEDAATLGAAARLQQSLQHVERVALDAPLDPETAGEELRGILARAGGAETFEALERTLTARQRRTAEIVARLVG